MGWRDPKQIKMKFKEAFEKYKNGEATPEEEAFVLTILEKGDRIAKILDEPLD